MRVVLICRGQHSPSWPLPQLPSLLMPKFIHPITAMNRAIGIVETRGMPTALVAADVMNKTGDVELVGFENTDAGFISVIIKGTTGSVQVAIAAVPQALQQHPGATLLGHHILPCPDGAVDVAQWLKHQKRQPPRLADSPEWLDD